jgi:hypothetical protein
MIIHTVSLIVASWKKKSFIGGVYKLKNSFLRSKKLYNLLIGYVSASLFIWIQHRWRTKRKYGFQITKKSYAKMNLKERNEDTKNVLLLFSNFFFKYQRIEKNTCES